MLYLHASLKDDKDVQKAEEIMFRVSHDFS